MSFTRQPLKANVPRASLVDPTVLPAMPNHHLADKVGLPGRWRTKRKLTKVAEEAYTEIEIDRLHAHAEIHRTQVGIAKAAVVASLVVEGVNRLSALTNDLVARRAAAQMSLAASSHAETLAHFETRADTCADIRDRVARNEMSSEEAEAVFTRVDSDLAYDVDTGREFATKAKEVVNAITDLGFAGLHRSIESLR